MVVMRALLWCALRCEGFMASNLTVDVLGLGTLTGLSDSDGYAGVASFRGVPYGKAPIGDRRWQPPQPHGPWESPRDATVYGDACMGSYGGTIFPDPVHAPASEDCLFLNIAAPILAVGSMSRLPVMIWIHGGGYSTNDGAGGRELGFDPRYTDDALVTRSMMSVVVVTVSFRQNIFGFLGSSSMQKHSLDGSTGNFGIQDQRLAFQWVRDHIHAFGGNGADVTIFGESSGGDAVVTHLASPLSLGLFGKSIIQSGAYGGAVELSDSEAQFQNVLAASSCVDLECLLALNSTSLQRLALSAGGNWGPTIDGVDLVAAPLEVIASGQHPSKVPVIVGSTRDEMAIGYLNYPVPDEDAFDQIFSQYLSSVDLERLKELYSPGGNYSYPEAQGDFGRWWWEAMRADTDRGLGHCGARRLARQLLAGGSEAVFSYLFAQPTQSHVQKVFASGPGNVVVPHSTEILYVFGASEQFQGSEAGLAAEMAARWARFAETSDPNQQGLAEWPRYDIVADQVMEFAADASVVRRGLRADACAFWDAQAAGAQEQAAAHDRLFV